MLMIVFALGSHVVSFLAIHLFTVQCLFDKLILKTFQQGHIDKLISNDIDLGEWKRHYVNGSNMSITRKKCIL